MLVDKVLVIIWYVGRLMTKFVARYLAFFDVLGSSARWGRVLGVPWQIVTGGRGELAAGQGPKQQIGGRKYYTFRYPYNIFSVVKKILSPQLSAQQLSSSVAQQLSCSAAQQSSCSAA